MTDVPGERPAQRRLDLGVADLTTQVELGWQASPPEPPPAVPPPPETAPIPPVQEAANVVLLDGALLEAGVVKTPADTTAVQKIATLDQATVSTVAAWVKRGKKDR